MSNIITAAEALRRLEELAVEMGGIKTENTAAGVAALRPGGDKYAPDSLVLYRTSLALYRNLADSGELEKDAYCHIRTILNKKYGLSSDSIFAESA